MGRNDSSKTRVVPVFAALKHMDPTGRTWLRRLMTLGSSSVNVSTLESVGELPATHPDWWGKNERRLPPPPRLLKWLVQNVSAPATENGWAGGVAKTKRRRLVSGDAKTIAEALHLLRERPTRRAWYVLEGESRPDACLETDRVLLVVEGKRSESGATSATTWMPRRSQILRHMDAATEIADGRRVFGLMIVEGLPGADGPSQYWLTEAADQVAHTLVADSLPHRTALEREQVVDGFLGVTTWQCMCREFGLLLFKEGATAHG